MHASGLTRYTDKESLVNVFSVAGRPQLLNHIHFTIANQILQMQLECQAFCASRKTGSFALVLGNLGLPLPGDRLVSWLAPAPLTRLLLSMLPSWRLFPSHVSGDF